MGEDLSRRTSRGLGRRATAKANLPVGKALTGVDTSLDAGLET